MSEDEPVMNLNTTHGEIEARRDNTTLFTFLGKLALYDHVFIHTGDTEDDVAKGMYIFNQNEVYDQMSEYMWENDYPMHINLPEVAQCDLDAFDNMVHKDVEQDLESGIPEEWLGGGDGN